MADQQDSKKDTVRINLPAGVTGRAGAPASSGSATQRVKAEDEAKKETAVMGSPVPGAKKDTSRVQVAAAKPSTPEMPRPTVRLRREETPTPATVAPTMSAPVMAPVVAAAPSGAEVGLAVGAMVLSVAVLVYLAVVALG